MSIIPPPLSPIDTLSPSPSWTSIQLGPCCQVGRIPLILHTGVGNLHTGNSINGGCSDVEQDDSGSVDSFNLAYRGVPEENTGTNSTDICSCSPHKSPTSKRSSVNASIKPPEKTRLMKNPPQVQATPELPPQPTALPPVVDFLQELPSNVLVTPESSPEKPRHIVHKGSVHATSEYSPTPSFWSFGSPPPSPGTGKVTGRQLPSGHKRNGSTSTTDSGLSSRSNPPLIPHDANNILLENEGIGTVRFPLLPVSLSWLQSTTLEIMIDQEGFRMVKPVFKLAGYAPPRTKESEAVSLGAHLVSATADFMPVQRKYFAFHYSELETPPVLRRLTLNGDESRDYLSKQAYLTLKANGPYTVQGIEHVQSSSLFLGNEHSVLSWRFDYLVGDRRTEAGRTIPGEKTFTPLCFSCSPALLLPSQGKKIRVMHVVKKSVAAKLTATKVEPPRPPSDLGGPGATPLSDAESELPGAVTGTHNVSPSNSPQDTPTHLHGTTEVLPHLSESRQPPTRKFVEEKMDCYGH